MNNGNIDLARMYGSRFKVVILDPLNEANKKKSFKQKNTTPSTTLLLKFQSLVIILIFPLLSFERFLYPITLWISLSYTRIYNVHSKRFVLLYFSSFLVFCTLLFNFYLRIFVLLQCYTVRVTLNIERYLIYL